MYRSTLLLLLVVTGFCLFLYQRQATTCIAHVHLCTHAGGATINYVVEE